MLRRSLPWYKRDVDAWRGGTRGMRMELRGFYSECLDAMWNRQGPIERDASKLAILLCCNRRSVRKLLPQLLELRKLERVAIVTNAGPDFGYLNARMATEIERAARSVRGQLSWNSNPIGAEVGWKVPNRPINSTREREVESDEEIKPPYHSGGEVGISIEGSRVKIGPSARDDLEAEFPGADIDHAAIAAAPDCLRFRHPSQNDLMAVVRKALAGQRRRPASAASIGGGQSFYDDFLDAKHKGG